jgi:PAS domain S-box-containing protein
MGLVEQLAGSLDCEVTFVAKLSEERENSAETIAVWSDGAPAANFTYALGGTPCADVMAGELCCFPSDVQRLFPADPALVELRSEGYLGMPLRGTRGEIVGLIVCLFRELIREPLRARSLIRIFGNRTAMELERQRDLAALREGGARFQMLLQNPQDLITEIDESGRFLYTSPNFDEILGYTSKELIGRRFLRLVHPADQSSAARDFGSTVDGSDRGLALHRLRCRDGSYRWLESSGASYRSSAGERVAIFISHDITERLQIEQALRSGEELPQSQPVPQSQKMEAIGRLAGSVAHDFNNLLTAIIGYGGLLLEEIGDSPARQDAQEILNAAERAEGLTRQLLAFSRRQVLHPTLVDVNSLVTSLERMLQRLIGEEVEFSTRLDESLFGVRADRDQLAHVILNLAANARDAVRTGGKIDIETSDVEISPDSASSELPAGEYACVSVLDTGVGMDAGALSRIFEPFFSTKQREKGAGLGLSTVYGIVRQSGGYIQVTSQLGEGTQVRVYLPGAESIAALKRRRSRLERYRGSETVLVVEDSDPVRQLVERYLRRLGYEVISASESGPALAHCEHHPGPIDLLITDVILPRMDGVEVALRAREIRPDLRVLYMSGFSGNPADPRQQPDPDFVLLEKPFTPVTLLRMVRERLDTA